MELRGAETLDRVVASVGTAAITWSDLEAEYRFELFQEGRIPHAPPDPQTLVQIRDRLIDQMLLAEEAKAGGVEPERPLQVAAEIIAEARKKFSTEEDFESARNALGMDGLRLRERITIQQEILRMIDRRLRPAAWPEQAEVETYYRDEFLRVYNQRNSGPPPPLSKVENDIRELLVQRKIDLLLKAWLAELRASRRVRVHSPEANSEEPRSHLALLTSSGKGSDASSDTG